MTNDLLERNAELEKYNVGLASENEKLMDLLRQVSCMMHLWDSGLDPDNGVEVWDSLLSKIDAELERTDLPLPDAL